MGKRTALSILFGFLCITWGVGCSDEKADYCYEFRVRNQGPKEIRAVTINTGGVLNDLGYLSSGGRGATASGCQFRYSVDSSISWDEENMPHKATLDLLKYETKKKEIQSFHFIYLGSDKWQVTAHSKDVDPDSPEVKP